MCSPSGDSVTLVRDGSAMQITLYLRTYPVAGAPLAVSFSPDPAEQRFTFTYRGREYEAKRRKILVNIPEGAKLDLVKNLLDWDGDKGPVKSKAREVYDLAEAGASGFRMAK
jgi:hypothetical protein